MNAIPVAILSCAFLMMGISTARADLPPPEGYVEQCTVELKEQSGGQCETCRNSYKGVGENNPCAQNYADTDFKYVCQGWGGSVWTEVWCDNTDSGCAYVASGKTSAVMSASIGMAVLLLALRRKRRGLQR